MVRPFWPNVRLLGFARIELPSGLVLADVTVLMGDRGPWASAPSKPMIGKDGTATKDAAGKIKYVPVVEFTSKEVRQRFSDAVVAGLQAAHPEVFK